MMTMLQFIIKLFSFYVLLMSCQCPTLNFRDYHRCELSQLVGLGDVWGDEAHR